MEADKENYKTSETVDMKNLEAVKYAAEEVGLSISQYKMCADGAGTYNRSAITKWIGRHYDRKLERIVR
ncbi:RING finger protein [Pedobacter ureilyticus]|uniref:DUF3606 domain-containing protein n=1 Tax=Pedobacter ureilyticus TaxID=1393051 RepID=A0ABW9J8G0_9SPHI|nr:hypothetical protein [Pedobacter helvus]